ncbi:MAG TPA: ribonuclease HI [Spirochaetia bacterium]|nr:ribonuclease HI [Spirochaetales bacterium]HRS65195.1 ribonuclease HI [Spirochaetia bacterium]HOT60408.1 ribonuclease HI [Spirochaetales bacterium]HPD80283.1 ribonuclease HI [Spirochaetales bacterium]HQK35730.1 ribonuclease HI [Spirochaetales bacterium]
MPIVYLFADGACSGNPGPGGWGFIVKNDSLYFEASGAEPSTTNNRMELLSVIRGLEYIMQTHGKNFHIRIFTDSQYVFYGITKWIHDWKKKGWKNSQKEPVKNKELWEQLDTLTITLQPEFNWIRGHAGHEENERCDELARTAIKKLLEQDL